MKLFQCDDGDDYDDDDNIN